MIKNIPNTLTVMRIIIIPIIILSFYFDDIVFAHQFSAGLFLLASLTDFLDGFIARKFSVQSNFGKMLDPIADKLLIGAILLMLVEFKKAEVLPCILILSREFLVSGLREFLAGVQVSVPVSHMAKLKTTVQMGALFILLLGSKGSEVVHLDLIGKISLWVAAILTIITGYSYFKASYIYLSE